MEHYQSSRSHKVLVYSLVGTLVVTSIVLLAYAVWHYTYDATLEENGTTTPTEVVDEDEDERAVEQREYTDEERREMMHADIPSAPEGMEDDEEWGAGNTTSPQDITDEEREAMMQADIPSAPEGMEDDEEWGGGNTSSSQELTDEEREAMMYADIPSAPEDIEFDDE